MGYKLAHIDEEVNELLDQCTREFIAHHKEFEKIKISRRKIIYEVCKFYLKN
jgi:hypothetical protein